MEARRAEPPADFTEAKPNWPLAADHSRFVTCGSLTWHIQELGPKGATPLLLVHGTGGATHSMAPLATLLADRYRLLIPDLPGHGFTRNATTRHLSLPGMARTLAQLCQALDFSPAMGIGHSAGAAVLIEIALERHFDLHGIIGINAALEPIEGNAIFSPLAKALFVNPFVPQAVAWQAKFTSLTKTLLRNTGSPLEQVNTDAYETLLRKPSHIGGALGMMANWDLKPLRRRLPELKVPVELIVADDDTMVPTKVSREASTEADAITLTALPQGGHLMHELDPAAIAARIDAMAANLTEAAA
ncbi:MAG: alpha/beta fold hydrolase BchO [Pseudomonadota bacterium]